MKPVPFLRSFLAALAPLSLIVAGAAPAREAPATVASSAGQSLADLVAQVDIPYETFTIDNGLRVIVHTDRKAPIVGVTLYYRVGSKNEPRGKTGFAHLYEHLFFGGSENVPNFDIPLEGAGSNSTNGSTWYDRTNYVETLPKGALDLALMIESDRMGHLLGALTQEKLDAQRGVVQNELRQGKNQPGGLVFYRVAEQLLPVGHPYRHDAGGSMADLDAASLQDVRDWFTQNYGPNNAVLTLTGDIDLPTARAAVERWFGDIPRGPEMEFQPQGPVTLAAPIREVMTDQVSEPRIYRYWTGPGLNHPDSVPLEVGMFILGGLQSSRLDDAMVYDSESATAVSASYEVHEDLSFLDAYAAVAPDVPVAKAESELLEQIERLVRDGPTPGEVERAATQLIAAQVGGLESVGDFGGKGEVLAEGLLYSGDPGAYKKRLERIASLTPQEIRAAMQRWLSRPAYTLVLQPGERTIDGETMGGWGDEDTVPPPPPDAGGGITAPRTGPERSMPPIAEVGDLDFPEAAHATLSNGIPVTLVQRDSVPTVTIALTLAAGSAADGPGEAGRHRMMMDMLDQGTATRDTLDIVIEKEQLGAMLAASAEPDASRIVLNSLTTNLPQSLSLMADVALHPAFDEESFVRQQSQRLAGIEEARTEPEGMAARAIGPLLFGSGTPYAMASTSGDPATIAALTPADMRAEHDEWFRPDLASFTVVGAIAMDQLLPLLEQSFGGWQAPDSPAPAIARDTPAPVPRQRLVVIDRPDSPQSVLEFAKVLPFPGTQPGIEPLELADQVLGDGFLSRLMGELREKRGWVYHIYSNIGHRLGHATLSVSTSTQTDRTADSIRAILDQMAAFPATRPVDDVELQRVTDGSIRNLPNRYETNGQVLGALLGNELLGRPDDYQDHLASIYRAIDAEDIDTAAAQFLTPDDLTIVVVGDRSQIDAQLAPLADELGVEIEYLDAAEL